MVTNGLALTEKRFKELMQNGLRSMAISFDGMKDNHNWLRQHPLAFEGATRAIQLAAATPSLTWDVVTSRRILDAGAAPTTAPISMRFAI